MAIERGRSSGRRRLISLCDTTAWTMPDSVKPSISGHRISRPMANAVHNAFTRAAVIRVQISVARVSMFVTLG